MNDIESGDLIGIIPNAIVFGRTKKHYDIKFYNNIIEIIYLGEYRHSRMRQMFSRSTDLLIYKIIKNKKRNRNGVDRIIIRVSEISNIKLRYVPTKSVKMKSDYLLLEINTVRGKYEFYISAKIAKTARSIINKFYRKLREK